MLGQESGQEGGFPAAVKVTEGGLQTVTADVVAASAAVQQVAPAADAVELLTAAQKADASRPADDAGTVPRGHLARKEDVGVGADTEGSRGGQALPQQVLQGGAVVDASRDAEKEGCIGEGGFGQSPF